MKNAILFTTVVTLCALALFGCGGRDKGRDDGDFVTLKLGHVGHDHHLALFVAADNAAKYGGKTGIILKPVEDMKNYDLIEDGRKIAEVEVIKVGGGAKMPTALAQGVIEVGYGGVAAVLAAVDKGAPVRMISPLHFKGDMFVLQPGHSANTWEEFVEFAKNDEEPVKIGYKNATAVAKIVFEEALKNEGIPFSGDPADPDARVRMINLKGGKNLNSSIASGAVDGYVGNNPFPAIGEDKGILKVISDLEDLSKQTFKDHPCCCIAAHTDAIDKKSDAIEALLVLFLQGTETINDDLDLASDSAVKWIGVKKDVAKKSISTSGYSMEPSEDWMMRMDVWFNVMKDLGQFEGDLKDLDAEDVPARAYDFSLLEKATGKLNTP
jgi:NitT/TauT family transport system substrate-binding protein